MHPSLEYLESRKGEPCLVCFKNADRHHMKEIGAGRKRTGNHWEHFTTVNLCRLHHTELHQIGEKKFSEKYNINLWKYAAINLAKWIYQQTKEGELK